MEEQLVFLNTWWKTIAKSSFVSNYCQ